jgi:predicted phage terminase large subunit-like protein
MPTMFQNAKRVRVKKMRASELIAACDELAAAQAREQFFAFRKLVHPPMVWGWWVEDICLELQRLVEDFETGRRPKVAIMAPPQHGKSSAATDLIAWNAGRNPDRKTIFASYSLDLGNRTNLDLQRIIQSPNYQLVFPHMQIGARGWVCNTELIEYGAHGGSFRNTTVEGAITGMELHLGVIDDPVKGIAEAQSKVVRDRTWNWFAADFRSRFAENSAMLIIMTRWHKDDLLGRLIDRFPDLRVLRYPAIAECDDNHRRTGVALFPELKPLEFLEEQRKVLSEAAWQSIYQQNPIVVGGGIFPIEKLQVLPSWGRDGILKSVRYWDKAGSKDAGAYTAGVLMHRMKDGRFVIEHVARMRWSALEREQQIKSWAEHDKGMLPHTPYEIGVEQEPGSGGKESAEATLRMLAGYRCYADKVTGSKEIRAEPLAAQVQAGNVFLKAGNWHSAFLEECESFPNGKFKDQVDAAAGAFARLTRKPAYNLDAMAS